MLIALQAEIEVLQQQVKNHPEVTRYALKTKELQQELTTIQQHYPNHTEDNAELVRLQLE